MRIATWNVNSLTVRLGHVLQWLQDADVDVLLVQETKVIDEKFPEQAIIEAGYHVVFAGQKTYNGVAILSKQPITDVVVGFPGWDDSQVRTLTATIAGYRFVNVYVPNGQAVNSDKYQYKLSWLDQLSVWLRGQMLLYDKLLVMGDFNIAPCDQDVHDPQAWAGQVLVSAKEREAFTSLMALGLCDLFVQHRHGETIYSWWDYRQAAFRRDLGMRIDHICGTEIVAKECQRCWIDKEPRGWERPSDHTPVVADISAT